VSFARPPARIWSPAKRRAELEGIFSLPLSYEKKDEVGKHWEPLFDSVLQRIAEREKPLYARLKQALTAFSEGDESQNPLGSWRFFDRAGKRHFHGHGLADLLALWDYGYTLDSDLDDYRRQLK
jgi:hypothetical protein